MLTLPEGSHHPCTHSPGSAGLVQTFGVPERHLGSWKPVLRIGTDARGDWKTIHEYWIQLLGTGAAKAPRFLLTEVSPTLQSDNVATQISALVHNNFMSIHENANIMIVALSFEAVIKIHFQ